MVLLLQGHSGASASPQHSCGLTDRQFITNYQVQLEAVGMYGTDYLQGDAKAQDVINVAQDAARSVRSSAPFDSSLQLVRRYAPAMFLDYANAVSQRAAGKNAGREMYLAYMIGARVRQVLRDAQPALAAAGCDVSGML
ncbi:MAG TPA: hypothetical protein VNC40_05785 [Gaiellaceae bacterium]|nr:hypothetical protein [Gaiellaceae bacterium]